MTGRLLRGMVAFVGIRARGKTGPAAALAVTRFVIAEECGDELRMDVGGDHLRCPFG